jgi:hypothetical protein
MTDQCIDTKTRKVSYKFDIVFVLVFIAISILGGIYIRHIEYEGGLVNQLGRSLFPGLCYIVVELHLLVFCSIWSLIRVCLPPRTVKHILIKIACVFIPFTIFFGSLMITRPVTPVFLKGLEKWVLKEVDIKAIQQWLATDGQRYKGQRYRYDEFPKDLPACLTEFKPKFIWFDSSKLDGTLYIEFGWGGGLASWGVRVGPPSMKMPEEGMLKISESSYDVGIRHVGPGVYVFQSK